MRIKDLGIRPAPPPLRSLWQTVRGRAPAIAVQRREIPYWQERGWTFHDNIYRGAYQTRFAAFQGYIEVGWSGRMSFFLYQPSPEIRGHSHWVCFQDRGDGWYLVHMARQPKDASSGIMTVERLITEAYES